MGKGKANKQNVSLILMRHGESTLATHSDFDRMLSDRGHAQVSHVAKSISHIYPSNEGTKWIALYSPAQRTSETFDHVKTHLSLSDSQTYPDLYLATAETWLSWIYAQYLPEEALTEVIHPTVILVCIGHNPGLSVLASKLTGSSIVFDVADAVVLETSLDHWAQAGVVRWSKKSMVRPLM